MNIHTNAEHILIIIASLEHLHVAKQISRITKESITRQLLASLTCNADKTEYKCSDDSKLVTDDKVA